MKTVQCVGFIVYHYFDELSSVFVKPNKLNKEHYQKKHKMSNCTLFLILHKIFFVYFHLIIYYFDSVLIVLTYVVLSQRKSQISL